MKGRQKQITERCRKIVETDRRRVRGPEQRRMVPLIRLKDLGI